MRPLARVPVRHRVIAAFGLGSVAVSAVVAVVTWKLTTGYMLQQREQSVLRQASVNARLVETSLVRKAADLGALLTGLASSPEAAIFVRQPDGWTTGGTTDSIGPDDVPAPLLAAAERGTAPGSGCGCGAYRSSPSRCRCLERARSTWRSSRCGNWTARSGSSA